LQRSLRKNIGSLQLGFHNVNKTPSFVASEYVTDSIKTYDPDDTSKGIITREAITSFPVFQQGNFKKENITKIFAVINVPPADLQLGAEYYLITNYTYFNSLYTAAQYSTLFNVLHVYAQKRVHVAKNLNWYLDGHLQQATGNPPVNLPLILARSRFAFEGNFFKNLFLSTGFEVRYNSPYKADNYSPLTGQFVVQDTNTISNLPDIAVYLNFRIKSFKGFVRLENLNSIAPSNGFTFTNVNETATDYPYRGLWLRIGIWWSFVN
jgi:hypothetical protein